MQTLISSFLAFFLLTASFGFAQGTHTWEQSKFEDFEKGTAKGVAILSEGTLQLAPAFKQIYTTPSTFIWAIATDKGGNIYAAAGSPARVYRISPDGQASIIFEPKELQVQALVADERNGAITLYAATSPDGKVYKIEKAAPEKNPKQRFEAPLANPNQAIGTAQEKNKSSSLDPFYSSTVFFDPKTKYIWDMAQDAEGRLYVATGDRGEIFRVEKNGDHSLFFKSDEAHIRVLAFDAAGNLIAGSDGSGLVYRISPAGEGFVVYSAPKKEITALLVDPSGNIYAAGVGEKRASQVSGRQPSVAPSFSQGITSSSPAQMGITVPTQSAQQFPASLASTESGATGGSEIYMIAPDGSPKRIWSSHDDIVYALGLGQRGQLLAGTGNKGRIFSVRENGEFTDLLKAAATQVTAFAKAPNGGLCASTSNLGKLFLLGAAPDAEGSYESDVFDTRIFSHWGRAEVRGSGNFEFLARSGNVDNPDRNWSPWKKVELGTDAVPAVPPARFVQWKAVLHPGNSPARIESVILNYRPKNVAPVIDEVVVQVGARFQPQPRQTGDTVMVGGGSGLSQQQQPTPRFEVPIPALRDHDSIAVRWTAHDDNDDQLTYSVFYRGDNESRWKLLKDKLTDKLYSFDSSLLPDGGYVVKVVASDASSHSPDEALTTEKEGSRFEIDTTPPVVQDLTATMEGGQVHITFRAVDTFSPIKRAEYSLDAGDWQFVEPIGRLSDSRLENYDFSIPVAGPGVDVVASEGEGRVRKGDGAGGPKPAKSPASVEHVIVIRAYDRFDNPGAAKTVVRPTR